MGSPLLATRSGSGPRRGPGRLAAGVRAGFGRGGGTLTILFGQGGMGSRQSRDGDPIRGATDIVETELMTKFDGTRIASMLAADAQLDVRSRLPPPGDRRTHEGADAFAIQRGEGIMLEDVDRIIIIEELSGIIPL